MLDINLNSIIKFFLALCIVILLSIEKVYANDIREAVFAGKFYPSSHSDLLKNIDGLTGLAKKTQVKTPSGKYLKALTAPCRIFMLRAYSSSCITCSQRKAV